VRRVYIPKRGDATQQRLIGVTALEDKIVQRATVAVLTAVYGPEFAGFSYSARLSETGTPRGGRISPLAANLYMHYVFDLWAQRWRRTTAQGEVVILRFLDDFIVAFQERTDAERS
jgi:retron-type reverse transcriptase